MSFTKLKQTAVAMMLIGTLTACGSASDKIVDTIKSQVETDEPAVVQLQTVMTEQATFMESFDDLLKDAAKKYEKVEEVLADMKTQAGALKASFTTAQTSLDFPEADAEKLDKLLAKAEKAENYEEMNKLVEAYQAYKTNLEDLSANNVELMAKYETFLNDISGDMEFQTLENLIGELNVALEKVQKSYEAYTESATAFQTLLMNA